MPKVLVSNNSELLRHLTTTPFARFKLELETVANGQEAIDILEPGRFALAIIDAELPKVDGYEVSKKLKALGDGCNVVLILGRRITAEQMKSVAQSMCDEVLIAPMSTNELYDVVAQQLGLPRRGSERYSLDLDVETRTGTKRLQGRASNLSVDGARLIVDDKIENGAKVLLRIAPQGDAAETIEIAARVVWVQPHGDETIFGAAFEDVSDASRARLSRLTQWEVVEDVERTRIVIKGDITEATSFVDLEPALVGRVELDLSQVNYMNSLGVQTWVHFLENAPIHGYEFHSCSIAFVLQASLSDAALGRGTIISFFAPYVCETCVHEEERLLQSAAVLAAGGQPPEFVCHNCGGQLTLDDLPQRYLAFLHHKRQP